MLKTDSENAQDDLIQRLKELAQKYDISLPHLYHIINCWTLGIKSLLEDKNMPTVVMDHLIIFRPRIYKVQRMIKKYWVIYRQEGPKPRVIETLKNNIKVLRRLKIENIKTQKKV